MCVLKETYIQNQHKNAYSSLFRFNKRTVQLTEAPKHPSCHECIRTAVGHLVLCCFKQGFKKKEVVQRFIKIDTFMRFI